MRRPILITTKLRNHTRWYVRYCYARRLPDYRFWHIDETAL